MFNWSLQTPGDAPGRVLLIGAYLRLENLIDRLTFVMASHDRVLSAAENRSHDVLITSSIDRPKI